MYLHEIPSWMVRTALSMHLVVCCGAGTTFPGSDFRFCIVLGIEFLAVGFDCFVLTSIVCMMDVVMDVVMGIDGLHETGSFSTSCTVNMVHAISSRMGAGFLLSCFCVWFVVTLVRSLLSSRLLVSLGRGDLYGVLLSAAFAFQCQLFVVLALVGVMSSCAISAGLDFRPACPGMVAELLAIEALLRPFHKGTHSEAPVPSGNLMECSFPVKTTFTMSVWFANFVLLFHFVIRVASCTISSCRRSSSVMQDGTPIKVQVFLNIVSMVRKEHSFPLRSFTSVKIFLDRSSLGTSKAFPVRVILLTTFTQGYFRWSSACGSFLDIFRIFGRSPLFPYVPLLPLLAVSSSC